MKFGERPFGDRLTPDEQFIRGILSDYKPTQDERVWVRVRDLYDLYRRAEAIRSAGLLRTPKPISRPAFGAVLNSLYPECPKCRRRFNGRVEVGRSNLSGPAATRSTWQE